MGEDLRNFCKRIKIQNIVTMGFVEGYTMFLLGIETLKKSIGSYLLFYDRLLRFLPVALYNSGEVVC